MTAQLIRPTLEAPVRIVDDVPPTVSLDGPPLISFAEVAAEDPAVSIARECEICDHLEELDHTHV